MAIKITFDIDDAPLEADIQQAQIDAKMAGLPLDQFLENAARSGFEQFRGARKRLLSVQVQRFAELVNLSDPEQTQWVADILAEIEAKLEALQAKPG